MTNLEMIKKVEAVYEENEAKEDGWRILGLRFEDKVRKINDICECSRNNIDREDEREFPEYGTDEYNNSPEFDGTSAWDMAFCCRKALEYNYRKENINEEIFYEQDHCYVVAGQYDCNRDDGLDYNEIVIEDAKVIAIIF